MDKAVIIASDGIWDRLSNQEVTQLVMSPQYYNKKDSDGVASHLVNEAVQRWQKEQGMIDDITIIVAYLNIDPSSQKIPQPTIENQDLPISPPSGADNLKFNA
jgi:serine/threonine protein phosphatase PrpC